MKNSFFLVIPDQKNDPELLLSYEEGALAQWLNELPSANPSLSTRLFHDLIMEMNTLVMDPQKRLNALELLRQPFLMMEDLLRSKLISSGFPKSVNDRKIMNLTVSLERHFTIGYWMIVRELTRREQSWFKSKHIALSIQRTMRGLNSIIVTHYMMNCSVPDWIWIDLHSLYKLSIKLKKDTTKVNDISYLTNKSCSIEECYKQILLFSLTDPAALMQKELQKIYHFIEKITHHVQFSDIPIDALEKQCIISMDEDNAPCFIATTSHVDASTIFLDLTKLHKAFQQGQKFFSGNEPRYSSIENHQQKSTKLPVELFNFLCQRWNGKSAQVSLLFADRQDRLISIGLEATYNLQTLSNISTNPDPAEIHALSYSEKALSARFESPNMLAIGSMISWRRPDQTKNQRMLGVISKITLPKQENELIFEIALITAQFFSVNYRSADAEIESKTQKALLYAKKENDGEKSYIIMDSFLFKEGDILRMSLNDEEFPIIIRDRINIGIGYWQFECRRIAEKNLPQNKTSSAKKGYDFI